MPSKQMKGVIRAVKVVLILLVVLLLGPPITRWLVTRVVDTAGSVFETQTFIDTPDMTQAIASQVRQLCSLTTAEYRGVAFIRKSTPIRLLGIRLAEVELWKQLPGLVRASVDLLGYDLESRVSITSDRVSIVLPEPGVSSCDLDLSRAVSGSSFGVMPMESIEEIALVEDSMYIEAREQLITEAVEMGLLEEAEANASRDVVMAVQTVLGDRVPVEVTFSDAVGGNPRDCSSWQVGDIPRSTAPLTEYLGSAAIRCDPDAPILRR